MESTRWHAFIKISMLVFHCFSCLLHSSDRTDLCVGFLLHCACPNHFNQCFINFLFNEEILLVVLLNMEKVPKTNDDWVVLLCGSCIELLETYLTATREGIHSSKLFMESATLLTSTTCCRCVYAETVTLSLIFYKCFV